MAINFEELKLITPGGSTERCGSSIPFIVLENNTGSIMNNMILISAGNIYNSSFGNDEDENDYADSALRELLNGDDEAISLIRDEFAPYLVKHKIDLQSLNGGRKNVCVYDDICIPTFDEIRKYSYFIPRTSRNYWTVTGWYDYGGYLVCFDENGQVFENNVTYSEGVRVLIELRFNK